MSVTSDPVTVVRDEAFTAAPDPAFGGSWPERHLASVALRLVVVAVPLVLAQLTTISLARRWSRPEDLWSLALWWAALVVIAVVIVESASIVTRRLLPLAALLRLPLAFPSVVPSRFRIALRAGNPRRLERLPDSSDDVATRAAKRMLELVAELTIHDRATRGHSERVRAYAELIGEELGLGIDDRHRLRWGALLHDLGKLRVPAEILNKAGRLTDDEFDRIKRHPLDGLELAMPLWPWLGPWVLAISDHHERWEGGGYPSGAAGTDIALAGRIVAVADAYDVMTSSRSYKAPVSVGDARAELVRCSGTQFDPDVVRAFLAVPAPRLRRVGGPLSVLVALLSLPDAVERFRRGTHVATAAGALLAVAVATTFATPADADADADDSASGVLERSPQVASSGGPTPSADRPSPPDPAGSPAADTPEPTAGSVDVPQRGGRTAPLVEILLPESLRPPQPTAPEDDAPRPDGASPPPPPESADPVALTLSPRSGEVVVEGLPIGDLPVEVDAVGATVCARMGLCDDIVVETPIVLPQLGP